MTRAAITELVLLRLEGGDYADSSYTMQEINAYIEQAFNKLYRVSNMEAQANGIRIPSSQMLVRYKVQGSTVAQLAGAVYASFYPDNYYAVELPVAPIQTEDGTGIYKVHTFAHTFPELTGTAGAFREFVPVPNGQLAMLQGSNLSQGFLDSIDHYQWDKARWIFLRFKDGETPLSQLDFIVYLISNNFASIANDDEIYFPQDMVNDIITMTVQMLSGAKEDDSSNNFNQVR